jgi:hypothetical protein
MQGEMVLSELSSEEGTTIWRVYAKHSGMPCAPPAVRVQYSEDAKAIF